MGRLHKLKNILLNRKGFTLIEIIVVLAIISVMSLLIIPRISNFFDSTRSNFFTLITVIAKTFDDSFLRDRTNFLLLHLHEPMEDADEEENEIFARPNGVSVVNMNKEGKFVDSTNRLLRYREFPDSFKIEAVIISTGEEIGTGNVMIPFYPKGYSDNAIIHVMVNEEEEWSIRIYKLQKEAEVIEGYIDFEES